MRIISFAVAVSFGLLVAGGADAKAAACKDAGGKFIKCPPAATAALASPGKPGTCKDAKGKFIKCPSLGAPVAARPAATPSSAGAPAGATAKCKDGTYSMSKTHSGSCSRHGGVANWL